MRRDCGVLLVGLKLEHLLIFLIWTVARVQGLPKVFRTNEICGVYNGHRVYLELGDRGQLQATNVTVSKVRCFRIMNGWLVVQLVLICSEKIHGHTYWFFSVGEEGLIET